MAKREIKHSIPPEVEYASFGVERGAEQEDDPAVSLNRSADFWTRHRQRIEAETVDNMYGSKHKHIKFPHIPQIVGLLRVIANNHQALLDDKHANPSNGYVVICHGDGFLHNDDGHRFFESTRDNAVSQTIHQLSDGQPSLVYNLRIHGISPDDVWCPTLLEKNVWGIVAIPKHIIEATLQ